jgi:hypothetical protein
MIAEAVLAMSSSLPGRDYKLDDLRATAIEIARIVTAAPRPIFASRELDAAVMLETAYAEARFVTDAIGDHGAALCVYQLHFAPRSVLTDLGDCTARAYELLRWSVRSCKASPLAPYIGNCDRRGAQVQSRERMRVARYILAETQKRREWRSTPHLERDMMSDAQSASNMARRSIGSLGDEAARLRLTITARQRGRAVVAVRRVGRRSNQSQRTVRLSTVFELMRCVWVIPATGEACGKPTTHIVTFSDEDRAPVCADCAIIAAQIAAGHQTKVKVEKLV